MMTPWLGFSILPSKRLLKSVRNSASRQMQRSRSTSLRPNIVPLLPEGASCTFLSQRWAWSMSCTRPLWPSSSKSLIFLWQGMVLWILVCGSRFDLFTVVIQLKSHRQLYIINSSNHFCVCVCVYRSEKAAKTEKRIANIIEYLTFEVFRYTVRGLYENHKFIFTLLLALKIDLQSNKIEQNKFQILIKGKIIVNVLLFRTGFHADISHWICPRSYSLNSKT